MLVAGVHIEKPGSLGLSRARVDVRGTETPGRLESTALFTATFRHSKLIILRCWPHVQSASAALRHFSPAVTTAGILYSV